MIFFFEFLLFSGVYEPMKPQLPQNYEIWKLCDTNKGKGIKLRNFIFFSPKMDVEVCRIK